MISTRTKAALEAAKAGGVKLGGPKLAQARRTALEAIGAAADNHAANVLPIIRRLGRRGPQRSERLPTLSMRAGSRRHGADGGTLRP
jgi:DNA invertase Pin-like site-specific DNA recombinase